MQSPQGRMSWGVCASPGWSTWLPALPPPPRPTPRQPPPVHRSGNLGAAAAGADPPAVPHLVCLLARRGAVRCEIRTGGDSWGQPPLQPKQAWVATAKSAQREWGEVLDLVASTCPWCAWCRKSCQLSAQHSVASWPAVSTQAYLLVDPLAPTPAAACLAVGPGVLIPRPETELMIDFVGEAVAAVPELAAGTWADLGTGSGALAVGVARALPQAQQVRAATTHACAVPA